MRQFKLFVFVVCLFPLALHSWTGLAQSPVSGIVTDDSGAPLIGVNVYVEGTTIGTVTGIDGKYQINATPETPLTFDYMGYERQVITVGNRQTINVTLSQSSLQLDDVVVIGYGTQRKSDVTGAVVRADLDALQNSPSVSLSQLLKGTVPGLNIGTSANAGSSPSISIRGQNSISGTTDPLIVLDGIIYRGDLIDINPSDIGSIDVLKDASSAAIYGSQASNGVILITTKTENRATKPVIEYSANFSIQSSINPDMKLMNREEYLQMVADSYIEQSRIGPDYLQPNPNWNPAAENKFIEGELNEGYYNGTDTDWYDLTTIDMPYIQNHNVSIRGRSDNSNYFLSFGLTDQKNLIKHDEYQRYSFRVNLETKITNWLKVGTQSFFSLSDTSGQTATMEDIGRMQPLIASHDADGNLIEKPSRGLTNFLLLTDNPDLNQRYSINGTFYADIAVPFVEGLSYRINYSNSMTFFKQFHFDPYANGNLGSGYKNNSMNKAWTLDNIVTYKRAFGPQGAHDINATLVYGVERRDNENTNASAQNFSDLTLGYNYLGAGQSDLNTISSGAWKETSLYMMARVAYSYKGRYSLTATVRRDGFSGFGPGNKFAIFPSFGAAWRISDENFFRNSNINWVDNLKLRVSYGSNGNRTAGRYATMARMNSSNGYLYGDGATAEKLQNLSTMPNYTLQWETTNSFNVGVDFSLLNGRIWGSYEFYHSKTHDLLYEVRVPAMNGFGGNYRLATNIGELQNTGHELSLGATPIRKRDFSWDINFNFSRNRNKVNSILGVDADGDGREDDLTQESLFIGRPLNTIYDYRLIGMYQLSDWRENPDNRYGTYKVEDLNSDGKIDPDNDKTILGYEDPSYRFSIQNKLRYKNWELNIFINSVQGGSKYYKGQPLSTFTEGKQWNFYKFDYWTPENPNAKYRQPGAWNESLGASFSPYVSRSFIRLQELSLSYSLPKALLQKINIARVRVFVSANNLFTITKWDGWDPESNRGVQYLGFGSGYPTMKNYTIGLNLEF